MSRFPARMTRLLITTFLVLLMGLVACTEIVPDDLPDDFFNEDLQASATDWSHYYKFYRCPRDENDRFHTEVLYDVTNETEIDTDVSNEAQTVDRTETKNDTRTVNGTDRCQKNCTGDADCPGTKKCCSVGCDQICVEGLSKYWRTFRVLL